MRMYAHSLVMRTFHWPSLSTSNRTSYCTLTAVAAAADTVEGWKTMADSTATALKRKLFAAIEYIVDVDLCSSTVRQMPVRSHGVSLAWVATQRERASERERERAERGTNALVAVIILRKSLLQLQVELNRITASSQCGMRTRIRTAGDEPPPEAISRANGRQRKKKWHVVHETGRESRPTAVRQCH